MRYREIYLLIALLALFMGQAKAQRHLRGMRGVQLTAEMVDGFHSPGNRTDAGYAFSLAVFNYAGGGHKWMYGGEVMRRNCPYPEYRNPPCAVYGGSRVLPQSLFLSGKGGVPEYRSFRTAGL